MYSNCLEYNLLKEQMVINHSAILLVVCILFIIVSLHYYIHGISHGTKLVHEYYEYLHLSTFKYMFDSNCTLLKYFLI